MAQRVGAVLVGKEALQKTLGMFKMRAQAAFRDVCQDSAMAIQRDAKERCPVRKDPAAKVGGRLRGSIMIRFYNNGLTAEVGSNVEYAAFVEFGTGRRGAGAGLRSVPAEYAYGNSAGMNAQPYLWPALEAERPKFIARVRNEVGRGFGI